MLFLIASITPVLLFIFFIYFKDKEKEPLSLLLKCFFGGFLSIIITLLLNIPLSYVKPFFDGAFLSSFFDSFFSAALMEEFSKWIILIWIVWKSKHFDQHYDAITYAVFVSMGFALVENILYVFQGGLFVALIRAVLAVPGHGLNGVLMGYHLSLAKFGNESSKKLNLWLSLLIPICFHGLYDFFLMYISHINNPILILSMVICFTLVVIFSWKFALRKIKKSRNNDMVNLG